MKRLIPLVVAIAVVLAWAPWITEEYARNKVMSDSDFVRQHGPGSGQENPEIHVNWFPFGRWVTTYDRGWFVSFYGAVLP